MRNLPGRGICHCSEIAEPMMMHSAREVARRQFFRQLQASVLAAAVVCATPKALPFSLVSAVDDPVAAVLRDVDWEASPPFSKGDFRRLDETDDGIFYETPRLVYHVDDAAVAATTSYYGRLFTQVAQRQKVEQLAVLDLCSSWVSHYPQAGPPTGRVAGLGMNAAELQQNPQLTEWVVADLNKVPCRLPYADNSFDVVTCTVSIDYLTQPLAVMGEVARVLRPGGSVAVVFSNRLFFSKAVAVWTGKDDLEHIYTVGSYMHYGAPGILSDPEAIDLTPRSTSRKPRDPLYAVVATKLPVNQG